MPHLLGAKGPVAAEVRVKPLRRCRRARDRMQSNSPTRYGRLQKANRKAAAAARDEMSRRLAVRHGLARFGNLLSSVERYLVVLFALRRVFEPPQFVGIGDYEYACGKISPRRRSARAGSPNVWSSPSSRVSYECTMRRPPGDAPGAYV